MYDSVLKKVKSITGEHRGSTLITVIVAIAFVTILTSIILGTTVVNVRMKGIDQRTKDDFYYAEKALNDIYTGVGQEIAKIAGDEYEKAFNKVGTDSGDFGLAEEAEKEFRKEFISKSDEKISTLDKDKLKKYITSSARNENVEKVGPILYQKADGSPTTKTAAERLVISGLEISATDTAGFRSVISTDIVIDIPTLDFLGTNADVSDYGLIANKGLYIEGDGTGADSSSITGNVYAGVHDTASGADGAFKEATDEFSREKLFGGINIKDTKVTFGGNYIVSKGDINLAGKNPGMSVSSSSVGETLDANLPNLWYTSLRTVRGTEAAKKTEITIDTSPTMTSPLVNINANVFALNDLTLNADKSSVKIAGNYYGYNDMSLPESQVIGVKTNRDDGESSSIVINGSNVYFNMEDIRNFVLMGKAYIDFTSNDETDAGYTTKQVVPTAEGLALKTNQQVYLFPPDFLDGPNPVQGGTGKFTISIPQDDLENWFGYKYLDKSISDITRDDCSLHEKYTVVLDDGSNLYFDYLKFNNDKWMPILDEYGKVTGYEDTPTAGIDLGEGGSISSQQRFFYEIMTSESEYEKQYNADPLVDRSITTLLQYIEDKEADPAIIQPSAYRIYDRIKDSMGNASYFNLQACVVGDGSDKAHYYAKNAVVNYKKVGGSTGFQSNVLHNTDGMLRYANYPLNLFRRYISLCTKLDGNEKIALETPLAEPSEAILKEWKDPSENAPIKHFVMLGNIKELSSTQLGAGMYEAETQQGLKPGVFGACIATKGNLVLTTLDDHVPAGSIKVPSVSIVGSTFKGVAIVDGDITVDKGINVDGLLMATGTITMKGNNHIYYDKGLIQSRIEKEMNIIKNDKSASYKDYYLINYLSKDKGDGTAELIYQVTPGSKINRDRIEADYNDFMHYENWQKGEK